MPLERRHPDGPDRRRSTSTPTAPSASREEAQARGHELFYYTPDQLAFREGRVTARGWPLTVRRVKGDHVTLGAEAEVDLSEFDVVWLRQDPPFDMGYITTTHLLDMIHPGHAGGERPVLGAQLPRKAAGAALPRADPADR